MCISVLLFELALSTLDIFISSVNTLTYISTALGAAIYQVHSNMAVAKASIQTRTLLLTLIVSLTCDSSFARRLRFHKPIDAHDVDRGINSNDSYFVRHLGSKSSKSESSDSLESDEGSSKSSKSSGSKSAKSSYSEGKSSKSSSYAGQSNDAAVYTSPGKSGKASYDISSDSLNEPMPISEGSNDYETASVPNGHHSNDLVRTLKLCTEAVHSLVGCESDIITFLQIKALTFETDEDPTLDEHAEFFPILFDPLDPEVLMTATSNPTKRPTPPPSNMPTPLPTDEPTMEPSNNPPAAPLPCGMSAAERSEQIINVLGVDSSDPDSPQSLALDWITNNDGLFLCPDNNNALIQRYVAAVFYYSIGGGTWNQCNAPRDLNDLAAVEKANDECNARANTFPDLTGGSNAWLSPSSECEWGGLACYPNGSIGEVSFGKLMDAAFCCKNCLAAPTSNEFVSQKTMALLVQFLLS